MAEIQYYHHGRFKVAGGVLPDAITAYSTYGDPQNPCIVFPTCYGAKLDEQNYMIGTDKALDPDKYFIVTFALFANGESSSPSNTKAPYNGPYFPNISYEDNIRAQHAILTKKLGVQKVFSVIGFSMGGQQAYYWAVMHPEMVERFVVLCSSARTSYHCRCFIEGPKNALLASKDFDDGHYTSIPQRGIRAFARAYSAWVYGQSWFRNKQFLYDGKYPDLNTFLHEEWEAPYLASWDANDLIALFNTWEKGDISLVRDGGDLEKCLGEIQAKGLIMPCKTDLCFPPEDSEIEIKLIGDNAKLVVIPSIWGHTAAGGTNSEDDEFIKQAVTEFFQSS
ncbi:homoserine acetyltransferase [Dentipellis sp. KUC8613]|nr:homoserine acetyltransferase [Dentipellis sp. KUC8613]